MNKYTVEILINVENKGRYSGETEILIGLSVWRKIFGVYSYWSLVVLRKVTTFHDYVHWAACVRCSTAAEKIARILVLVCRAHVHIRCPFCRSIGLINLYQIVTKYLHDVTRRSGSYLTDLLIRSLVCYVTNCLKVLSALFQRPFSHIKSLICMRFGYSWKSDWKVQQFVSGVADSAESNRKLQHCTAQQYFRYNG